MECILSRRGYYVSIKIDTNCDFDGFDVRKETDCEDIYVKVFSLTQTTDKIEMSFEKTY
jgi:hypothetical protein